MIRRFLILCAAALAIATPAQADVLIDNINGIGVDRDGDIRRFTAMVIDDNGRIVQIFERGAPPPEGIDFREDGRGRTVMPGFVDSHVHVMGIGFAALTLDLSQTTSLEEAQAAIAEYSEKYPNRPWILGRGWNQETWGLGRFPTAAEIDAVVADRPVWLERVDGHAGWGNSLALELAKVDASTRDPSGGRIERMDGSREPEGVLIDTAMELVTPAILPPRPEDRDLAFRTAQNLLIQQGVTAVADMGTTIEDWQAFRRAGDAGLLQMRIMSYAAGIDNMILIGGPGPSRWLYDDRLKMNGVKLYVDGALGSRGATLKADYHDDAGNRGLAITGPVELRNRMSRAAIDGFQTAIHAIGDEANADVLDAIADLAETYGGDRRWRIEHAQIVDPLDILRFGEHGTIASMQPVHQTSDRLMAEARLGPDRLDGAYAWRSIAATGAPLAFGTDAPVEPISPFAGLAVAISREDASGEPLGGWLPEEAVTREAALAAYTSAGAYAGFAEGRFGRLAVGERADFIVIDRDPLMSSPAEIRDTQVLETWIGGRKVFDSTPEPEQPRDPAEGR